MLQNIIHLYIRVQSFSFARNVGQKNKLQKKNFYFGKFLLTVKNNLSSDINGYHFIIVQHYNIAFPEDIHVVGQG